MTTDKIIDLRIWGKERGLPAPYPLIWHLVDAAAAADVMWDEYLTANQRRVIAAGLGLTESEARTVVAFLAGLHDIGKCIADFQRGHEHSFDALCRAGYEDPKWDSRLGHARASHFLSYVLLRSAGFGEGPSPKGTPAYRAAQVLGGHHGRFQVDITLDYLRDPLALVPQLAGESWRHQRELLADALRGVVGNLPVPTVAQPPALALVTGLIILADWMVSQESFIHAQQRQTATEASAAAVAAHFERTRQRMPRLLAEAGLGRSALRGGTFETMFQFAPNALQRSLVTDLLPEVTGPGLLVITAAPGEGKTEAALYAAQALARVSGANGCFFALPTMATSDQMYRRVWHFLKAQAVEVTSLTLLHSMAWLNPQYAGVLPDTSVTRVLSDVEASDQATLVSAARWLRSGKRGLLAQWATGTIDQALLAMLPVPHNTLRLLGISRKVLVVDEAHAYDAYMQFLLRRLMAWCGRLGCPVVLLSATLPSSVSRSLAEAYLKGVDHRRAMPADLEVPYPGWLFVPADGSPVRRPSDIAAKAIAATRPLRLAVRLLPVQHERSDEHPPPPGSRLAVLQDALASIGSGGGCAAVICNTVGDAQTTFEHLADWAQRQPTRPQMHLLHARFPAWQRQEITETVTVLFGKDAGNSRPRASIVVATQVIEQSMDLDFDVVISDLAPMALLLQRAGRCWRHAVAWRPAQISGPTLVVLDPVDRNGQHVRPPQWGEVYGRYLLRSTRDLLAQRAGAPIEVPAQVQDLVERVYCPQSVDGESFLSDYEKGQLREWDEHEGRRLADQQYAALQAIKDPANLNELRTLSHADVTDDRPPTRLGVDSSRLVPCYVRDDGSRWLDPAAISIPLPEQPADGSFSPAELALIMQHTVPIRRDQVQNAGPAHRPPPDWRDHFLLGELLLLPHNPAPDGLPQQPLGDLPYYLDHRLGLRKRKTVRG